MISTYDILSIVAISLGTGFGSAIGNYFAQRTFIRHLEKINIKK